MQRQLLTVLILAGLVAAGEPFRATTVTGPVQIGTTGDFSQLDLDDIFDDGKEIDTGGGECSVSNGKCVLKLSKGTHVKKDKPKQPSRGDDVPVFGIEKGSAYFSIDSKLKDQGVVFKIRTRVGASGVKGTKGLASYDSRLGMRLAIRETSKGVDFNDNAGRSAVLRGDEYGEIRPWSGALAAERPGNSQASARTAALARLLELVNGIIVTGTNRVAGYAAKQAQIAAEVAKAAVTYRSAGGATYATATLQGTALKAALESILGVDPGAEMIRVQKGIPAAVKKQLDTLAGG